MIQPHIYYAGQGFGSIVILEIRYVNVKILLSRRGFYNLDKTLDLDLNCLKCLFLIILGTKHNSLIYLVSL